MPYLLIPPSNTAYFYLCEGIRVYEDKTTAEAAAAEHFDPGNTACFSPLNSNHWQVVELSPDGSAHFHGRLIYHPEL